MSLTACVRCRCDGHLGEDMRVLQTEKGVPYPIHDSLDACVVALGLRLVEADRIALLHAKQIAAGPMVFR